jgi:ribosomal protein S18 acetylase RimI-like enzyme
MRREELQMITEKRDIIIDQEEGMFLGGAETSDHRPILSQEQSLFLINRLAEPAHEATSAMKQAQKDYARFMAEQID